MALCDWELRGNEKVSSRTKPFNQIDYGDRSMAVTPPQRAAGEREEEIFKSNMCHWQLVTVQIEPLVCALPQPHLWQHQLLKPTPYGVKILGKEKALESLERDSLIDSSKLNREAKNTWLGWQQQLMIWLFVAVNCRTRITVAYEVLSSWCWQQIPRGITPTWEYRDSGTWWVCWWIFRTTPTY